MPDPVDLDLGELTRQRQELASVTAEQTAAARRAGGHAARRSTSCAERSPTPRRSPMPSAPSSNWRRDGPPSTIGVRS